MQYILTEKEFKKLGPLEETDKWKVSAQILATKLAMEIKRNEHGWVGCLANNTSEYCDDCPAEEDCPYEFKDYSKQGGEMVLIEGSWFPFELLEICEEIKDDSKGLNKRNFVERSK